MIFNHITAFMSF